MNRIKLLHVLLALCISEWFVSTNFVASQEQPCDPFDGGTTEARLLAAEFSTDCPCTFPCTVDKVVGFVQLYSLEKGENNYTEIDLENPMTSELFNTKQELKFLIPGYTTSGLSWCPPMAEQLVKKFDGYAIIVDYYPIASCSFERMVSEIVPSVSQYLANTIQAFNFDEQNIELIGHSLGAHIAGYIGAFFNGTIPKIVGLDPAGPTYDDLNIGLNSSCAQTVEVLHTDPGYLGTNFTRGDVDFWANNGTEFMPGCGTDRACGHFKALFYYFASLFPQYIFIGLNCPPSDDLQFADCTSLDIFGLPQFGIVGTYYFETKQCFPYVLYLHSEQVNSTDVST